ncbi:hypothetical protein SCHPADRAFT_912557 [Schizopora paradoxa]|uniref:Acyltransferase MbtK/IucB-like conserved domain-containing protein n=1 Tax=Schizopora paradoxa TaxID=27342 RepID=A0A0H2SE22_9AGAM|nr:hypothetical protein SCHPADRAFT_912557 [Schizopora paradoxa]
MHWTPLLVLPDGARVSTARLPIGSTTIAVDDKQVLDFQALEQTAGLVLAAVGTPYEHENPVPKYAVVELSLPDGSNLTAADGGTSQSPSDAWAAIYALWTLFHEQEHIPITFSSAFNAKTRVELEEYVLLSGLARRALDPFVPHLFLERSTFWQGSGQGPLWDVVSRSWLQSTRAFRAASFPSSPSFTRTPTVIAAHPLRPPKPSPGECVYKRYCAPVSRTLALHALDVGDDAHMDAFHRFMNDELVNKGWGEAGSEEKHRAYAQAVWEDPHVLPVMMSWDGELMGYVEFTWIREDHVATYIPGGPLDYDRGLHALIGEKKFRGGLFSQCWMRSINHYMYLADPRTQRTFAEPKSQNKAMIHACSHADMLQETSFYFPYKHSVLVIGHRERFFKSDRLT